MKLKPIKSNMTELETEDARILFSYETPVAAWICGQGYVKTEDYYSRTTTKHVNQWLRDNGSNPDNVPCVPQKTVSDLVQ